MRNPIWNTIEIFNVFQNIWRSNIAVFLCPTQTEKFPWFNITIQIMLCLCVCLYVCLCVFVCVGVCVFVFVFVFVCLCFFLLPINTFVLQFLLDGIQWNQLQMRLQSYPIFVFQIKKTNMNEWMKTNMKTNMKKSKTNKHEWIEINKHEWTKKIKPLTSFLIYKLWTLVVELKKYFLSFLMRPNNNSMVGF